jgi:hypothetical protein
MMAVQFRSSEDVSTSDQKVVRSLSPAVSNRSDRNLNLYSLAAAAAGVGVLALATPADGKVVVTTKTIHLAFNQPVSLDLNRDGITDVQFSLHFGSFAPCIANASLTTRPPAGNGVVGRRAGSTTAYVSALARGGGIGPSANFVRNGRLLLEASNIVYCSGSAQHTAYGDWGGNPPNRYVGTRFQINGATHYGWIRLSADFPAKLGELPSATITAYAYETVANKAIKAGSAPTANTSAISPIWKSAQPSLGTLALGADGLAIWRREE